MHSIRHQLYPRYHAVVVGLTRRRLSQQAPPPRIVGKIVARKVMQEKKDHAAGSSLLLKAGLPFVFFSILASWVVSNALQGKLKEMEVSQGKVSKSIRQAKMEEEREEILERIQKIAKDDDFDNTKRIKRPHEILEERRKEREKRNAWHRRLYRYVFRIQE